jgi:hypothetical protein
VAAVPEPEVAPQELWHELRPLLDQELGRLPEKYRAVIVLCDLEGKTRKEAARHLGLPEGTVASRLATARNQLAKRLSRHGLAVSGAALATALSRNLASASVPTAVASSTIKAAAFFAAGHVPAAGAVSLKAVTLAEGVLKTMLLTKLKLPTAVLVLVAVLGAGHVAVTQQVSIGIPADGPDKEKPLPVEKATGQPATPKKEPTGSALGEKKKIEPLPTVVSGIAAAVDAGKNSVIVAHKEGEDTFTVPRDAKIDIDGKPGTLAGLPKGASVTLREFVDPRTARSIHAEGRWFWGTVKAVDREKNTISYGDKAQDGAAGRTFVVTKDSSISVDGKPGTLAGIPMGASVNLNLCVDQTTVRSLSAEGAQVTGLVKTVDVGKNAITVNGTTYPVSPDAGIAIDHKPGKLSAVPVGANVTLNLQVDQKAVLRITAGGASIFGNVRAVDVEKGTITVRGNPDDRTYQVAKDTIIRIDDQPGTLAGIPMGAGLHALNLRADQQTADGINVYGPGFHHVPVQAVDVEKFTITFDAKAPTELAGKTLAVARDARVEIDGKPGKLAGIPAGAFVNLGLSVDRLTARNLQAEGPNLGGCGGSMVKAVYADLYTLTFDEKTSPEVAGRTFTVLKDAWIQIDNRPGKLTELPPGSFANVTLTVDQKAVRSIGAQGPRLTGVVKSLDMAKNTVTVDGTTYGVAQDALIVIDGKQLPLAKLPIGASVNVNLRVDQKTVGMIQTTVP